MTRVVSNATADVKAALIEGFTLFINGLTEADVIEGEVAAGVDEVTKPGDAIESYRTNGTKTFKLLVNGGARDRHGMGTQEFIADWLKRNHEGEEQDGR